MPTDDELREGDKLDALDRAVQECLAAGETRGPILEQALKLWREGVWPDGTPADNTSRKDALRVVMNLVGESSREEELRINLVLDAKAGTEVCPECGARIRIDPRVTDKDVEEMFG